MKNQQGNVLVIILIAVILLAALSFAVSKGGQGGAGKSLLSEGDAKIATTQILKYAASVENTIKKLQLVNNCSEAQINFDANGLPWHDNTDAPADKSCDVFAVEGGGLTAPLQEPIAGGFSGAIGIEGFGTDKAELIYRKHLGNNLTLCNAINKELGITYSTSQPPADRTTNVSMRPFGQYDFYDAPSKPASFVGEGFNGLEADAVIFANEKSGCFTHGNTGNSYQFYAVLIAR